MSVNRHKPHLLIIPEDDANRQIANGFAENLGIDDRVIQILPEARGWENAVSKLEKEYSSRIRQYSECIVVLIIDFDKDQSRLQYVKSRIPNDLEDRIFTFGVFSNPENLKNEIGFSFEKIGEALADECPNNSPAIWKHQLLEHNETELKRIIPCITPFLFSQ
jgi:hypothetical protein